MKHPVSQFCRSLFSAASTRERLREVEARAVSNSATVENTKMYQALTKVVAS
jgi:hypothetical protein